MIKDFCNVIISEHYSLAIFEYYNVTISEHYSLGFFRYLKISNKLNIFKNIQLVKPLNAHISAPRAPPELIPELIVTEFAALSFKNNEYILASIYIYICCIVFNDHTIDRMSNI